jgi:hypothetical protein
VHSKAEVVAYTGKRMGAARCTASVCMFGISGE